nr:MAG TPA: hypothetical protein [Podoviridae sp. ctY3D12]
MFSNSINDTLYKISIRSRHQYIFVSIPVNILRYIKYYSTFLCFCYLI